MTESQNNARKGGDTQEGLILSSADYHAQDYSAFSGPTRRAIGFAASFAAMFSGLSSFIYYPALQSLAVSLGVSLELVNLTITSYLIVAGIAPSIIGDMADHSGRRPVYMITFALYFAANIGLAFQSSYAALLVLRMLQSAGASGTVAIAFGVISDIATPAQRGSYVGVLMGFTNAAPCLGPVIGGIIAEKAGWRWIFFLLSILSGTYLVLIILIFPETCRALVGDGSIPARGINRTVLSFGKSFMVSEKRPNEQQARNFRLPNPLKILRVFMDKGSFSVMTVGSIIYTAFGCLGASLSAHCIEIYGLNYLQAGLIYLPSGIGGIIAAYTIGRLLDHDYAVIARKHGISVDKRKGDDLLRFPIEEARLRSIWYLISIATCATLGYGWALQARSHLAIPLVMQFLTGYTMVGMFTTLSTLLTDLNPHRTSTSQAAYNLIRCLIGAAGVAALQAMVNGIGLGFCFLIYGSLCALSTPILIALMKKGQSWRHKSKDGRV